ncbi:MAG: Cof-type HAD-IIB family hydrolase [Phycisphaeraceae bacterium]
MRLRCEVTGMWAGHDEEDRPLSADPVGLVAIDLDGTLLRSDGSICAPSAEAIVDAAEKGVKIVLASGRSPQSMLPIYNALGLNTWMIAHNGAMIVDPVTRQVILNETMASPIARQTVEIARGVAPSVAVGVYAGDRCYTDTVRSRARKAALATVGAEVGTGEGDAGIIAGTEELAAPAGTLGDVLDQPVTKVMFVGESDVLGGIQMALQSRLAEQIEFAFSDLRLLQVVRRGVDKATAVQRAAEHYGISRQGVMTIGDAPNDIGMLRWAGMGIALNNAWEEVRRAAHFTCPSNNEAGVAEAFRKYVAWS